MSETSQSQGAAGGAGTQGEGDQGAGDQGQQQQGQQTDGGQQIDLTKLSTDELTKALENPNFFNIPRVKELLEKSKQADKLAEDQRKADEQKLKDEKKWEELSTQKEAENAKLKEQIQTASINQALMGKLAGEKAIDLDAALKLIDRSKLVVDDNGNVTGVDEAISALKQEKAYLFGEGGNQSVGAASNSSNNSGETGVQKFKRSQLTQTFINENKDAVMKAMNAGLIEDDGPPPQGQ